METSEALIRLAGYTAKLRAELDRTTTSSDETVLVYRHLYRDLLLSVLATCEDLRQDLIANPFPPATTEEISRCPRHGI